MRGGVVFVLCVAAASACGTGDHQLEADAAPERDGRADTGPKKDASPDKDATTHEGGSSSREGGSTNKRDGGKDATEGDGGETGDASEDADAPEDLDASEGDDSSPPAPTTPPSCVPVGSGTSQCGSSKESCCTSSEVTEGTTGGIFYRTYTNSGSGPTGEADPATVSAFRLDKYVVTVGRFRQFVAAWKGGYLPPAGSGKHTHLNGGRGLENAAAPGTYETGWDALDWNSTSFVDPTDANLTGGSGATWTTSKGAHENLPVDEETWYEAYAFCIWDGGFLPSLAEWEYAAAGGGGENGQREYPWGATDPGTANAYAIYGCNYPSGADGTCMGVASIAPVGTATKGAGAFGQLDLVGDLANWSLDSYTMTYVDPCADCVYSSAGSDQVATGGIFLEGATALVPWLNYGDAPGGRYGGIGFRCARKP